MVGFVSVVEGNNSQCYIRGEKQDEARFSLSGEGCRLRAT